MDEESKPEIEEVPQEDSTDKDGSSGGAWGNWGFTPFSVLSDLQKVARVAAEEISRNAASAASVAKSLTDVQEKDEDLESLKGKDTVVEDSASEETSEDENEKLRKSALNKLEKAGDDSFFGQKLKVLDSSVENFTSGAWQAIGSALKEGSNLVQKLENSAANLADSIQHAALPSAASAVAPSLLETGKAFTTKGMEVLELVSKETMDLLITETGIDIEKKQDGYVTSGDQLYEQETFDRCFYIYGGPEQLEELEALSNHYALLCNRKKSKLSPEQKSIFEGKLRQVQKILNLHTEIDDSSVDLNKGKEIESKDERSDDEMNILYNSSISKAADMAAGFSNVLAGLAADDIVQRTIGRLESLHSEGVHRLSEMCCFAVSRILMLGKSVVSNAKNLGDEEHMEKIEWPEDSAARAEIIRTRAQSMAGNTEAIFKCFVTGIRDVAEAFDLAMEGTSAETSVQEKANAFCEDLQTDQTVAIAKIQDSLHYMSFLLLSSSMPAI